MAVSHHTASGGEWIVLGCIPILSSPPVYVGVIVFHIDIRPFRNQGNAMKEVRRQDIIL
jgi:hypothetical protein